MIATGSPRKRYDKAAKVNADVLVSIARRDGLAEINPRSASATELSVAVGAILADVAR